MQQMNLSQFEYRMQTAVSGLVREVYGRIQLKLRIYFFLTVACAVLDLIAFFVQVVRFAEKAGDERADVLLLVSCYICLITDGYYIFWVKNLTSQLPPRYKQASTAALLGFGEEMKR